jgi:hypothetical protein
MSVHGDAWHIKGITEDHIGGLAADTAMSLPAVPVISDRFGLAARVLGTSHAHAHAESREHFL